VSWGCKEKKRVTIQLKIASGGPAGGQTFEKFDKQVLKNVGCGNRKVFAELFSKSDPPEA